MIAVAFMTVLQSLRLGPVGSGYLCPPVVSAIYLPSSLAAASSFGFSAVCGMVIFAGACEIAVASLINRTRKLFPAVVSGVVIMAVGLELGKIGASVLFEHAAAHSDQTTASFATAACALAAMTGLAVWATGLPKLFCSLIGILVGYAAAAAFHVFPPSFFADYAAAHFFAVPDPSFLSYSFAPSFAAPFAIAGLASGLRVIGVLTTCQQMNDAAWRRPDMQNIEAGVRADGLGCLAGGLLGVPGMSASPSLVSVEKTTGATSRVIAWSIAFWLILLSLPAEICRPHREHAAPGDGGGAVLQRRPHAGRGYADYRQPPDHASGHARHRIFDPGGDDSAGLSRSSTGRFQAGRNSSRVRSFPWRWSLPCRSTPSSCSARGITVSCVLGRIQHPQRPGPSTFSSRSRPRNGRFLPRTPRGCARSSTRRSRYVTANANGPVEIQMGSDTFDILVTLRYSGQSAVAAGRASEEGNGRGAELCQWSYRLSVRPARRPHRTQRQRRAVRDQAAFPVVTTAGFARVRLLQEREGENHRSGGVQSPSTMLWPSRR